MNSFGVFREKEIDGKPFLIFNFLSLTDNSSSFSSSSSTGQATIVSADDKDFSLQPHFLCPQLRLAAEMLKQKENGVWGDFTPSSISPHMNGVDKHVQYLLTDYNGRICKDPLIPIFSCHHKDDVVFCSACYSSRSASDYYSCVTCTKNYHKECVESPLFFKHPSFPFVSLQLYPHIIGCTERKCIFCREIVNYFFYHCPLYDLTMHLPCAMKSIPILIDHQKRHPHTLTFFPKQNSLACDVCSMVKPLVRTYICARCVYVVHQDCIYFPYVIRISRHQHRISFTCSLPSGKFTCGVCRRKVDNDCGAYSCDKCDGYYVHSRCALRRDLWDGEELEGVPEEVEIVVEPFEMMADGTIRHFSHAHHHLKLETVTTFDENKYCQACVLPIYQGNYYSCVDDNCDFILHETCAGAPLKKHHPLHARPLRLKVVTNEYDNNDGYFLCSACKRFSCSFVYEENDRVGVPSRKNFRLDIRCASISEPFNYEGHEHLLFLALSPEEEEEEATCQICQVSRGRKLNCIECNFIICFRCATIPYKAMYRHDKHILTFQKATVENDQSDWCEICEKKIVYSQKGGYYACDDYCCTILHVDCLLGVDPYMKHGQTLSLQLDILRNNTMTRPSGCAGYRCDDKRSLYRVFFKRHRYTYCSSRCMGFY